MTRAAGRQHGDGDRRRAPRPPEPEGSSYRPVLALAGMGLAAAGLILIGSTTAGLAGAICSLLGGLLFFATALLIIARLGSTQTIHRRPPKGPDDNAGD